MANITRNFIKGRMNKSVDERLIPDGEYVDAVNVRMGSTENSEIGVIENTKGNTALTKLSFNGTDLSTSARCIGAYEDGANETIYWFIHDSNFPISAGAPNGKIDLIVSYNVKDGIINYHVISVGQSSSIDTTLNFDPKYLITGIDLVENLLFFTDNKNAPRFININSAYPEPNSSGVDYNGNSDLLAERLLVIKRPPLYAPSINLRSTGDEEENYLEDRYICFAYRYKYADGEYSATSPFSEPAFLPKNFELSTNSYLNEGMVNKFNAVTVGYDTGGPLVESIELLFKEAQNSTIKVIDKFNKKDRGFSDNTTESYYFDNSNIFTILPDSEILRLYDNVPRFALAQTLMGNRLIYGNYIDGYNLERNGVKTQIEYTVDLISEPNSGKVIEGTTTTQVVYEIPTRSSGSRIVNVGIIDLTEITNDLKKGSVLSFDITWEHSKNGGTTYDGWFAPNFTPTQQSPELSITVSFVLPQDYSNIYELVNSSEFQSSVGTSANIKPVYAPSPDLTSCEGITFTDDFNCIIPDELDAPSTSGSIKKYASATSGANLVGANAYQNNEPIIVDNFGTIGDDRIIIQAPYMRFVDDQTNGADTTQDAYEFYDIIFASASFQSSDSPGSLHSNRGYEVGMVYMDDYGRSSTALVSDNNSLHIPCSASPNKNNIKVTIPTRQIAPEWATHYKFAIKPDEENYDTIYSFIYYQTTDGNEAYFLLEGENAQKVEKGDRLIIKADASGAAVTCKYVTVLEKQSYASGDLGTDSFAGVYIKLSTQNLNITLQQNSTITQGLQRGERNNETEYGFYTQFSGANPPGKYAGVKYPMSTYDGATWTDFDVPLGSRVSIDLNFYRNGGGSCDQIKMTLNTTMVATRDYDDMFDFFIGENFQSELDQANFYGSGQYNEFLTTKGAFAQPSIARNLFYWENGTGATPSFLTMWGTVACGGGGGISANRRPVAIATITVYKADGTIIFETQPQDALPDVWYESADTYEIDSNGFHEGNQQTQTATLPAIVNTDFFNCYSFGNGAESYKVRDSIVGKTFNLGNRVYTTDEKEYKEAHRFADLTYSGVYNEENNINKLNEFNLGLLNFKPLERTFGPIQKLFGRETDILTLQEDKISYVLQGKNLLSDAAAGSALTSVPEVLGTQIARIEEYGISNNPESFVQWGADKYFTDAKRGAVIQLKGSSARDERLTVISEQGMRTWFRDLFIDSFDTQKLGGFDPYMDEYVLSSNDILKPVDEECVDCGTVLSGIVIDELNPYEFCVDVGDLVGPLTIRYTIRTDLVVQPAQFDITYTYAGVTNVYTSADPPVSDTIVLNKSSVADQKVTISITNYGLDKTYIDTFKVGCPVPEQITIIPVSITSDANNGEYIHSEYSWTDGTFVSPLHSRLVSFENDNTTEFVISDYAQISGPQGAGVIPADGATVSIICNKINYDNFVFNKNVNNFRYLRSDTFYDDTVADIKLLLAETLTNPNGGIATPIDDTDEPDKYFATFTMPSTGNILYLIWDYRLSTEDDLCFGATIKDSCCNC